MSRFFWFMIGMMVGLSVAVGLLIAFVKVEKPAPVLNGAGRVDAAGRAEAIAAPPNLPQAAPPLFWPTYDAGSMRPGEHLYQLITVDGDNLLHSRSIELLPKLLASDNIPPSPHVGPPGSPQTLPPADHK